MATPATRPIYRSKAWKLARLAVLERAGWRCENPKCGRAGVLEVHHRRSLKDGGAPFEQTNLQALCRPCHFEATAGAARSPLTRKLRRGFLADL